MKSAKTAKAMKTLVSSLGRPPRADEVIGTLDTPAAPAAQTSGEASVQLNLRVPARVKQRVRLLAARDGITHSELVMRALAQYEESGGKNERSR